MTTDHKKALYGAARVNAIRKTENDVIAECLAILRAGAPVPADDGLGVTVLVPVRQAVATRLVLASARIERLKSGQPT